MAEGEQIPTLLDAGRRLKEARLRKGIRIQDAAEKVKVAGRFLEALEEGDLSTIPGVVYVKGFLRSYARFLGVDEVPLLAAVDKAGLREASSQQPPQIIKPVRREFGLQRAKRIALAAALVLLVGIGAGLAIKGAVKLWKYSERTKVPPSPFDSAQVGKMAQKLKSGPSSQSPVESIARKTVVVSVTAFQECWVQYQLDERNPKEMLMSPGEAVALKANDRVRVLIGNSGGVTVSGPSGPVRMPDKQGKVVHLLFTGKGMEKLEIPAVPSSTLQESSTILIP